VTSYVLDSSVLIDYLRKDEVIRGFILALLSEGHQPATTCVNVAEVQRGVRPREQGPLAALLTRLEFLPTTREAAVRAGRYQADFARRGRTIHTPDALVAGTARAHGAIVVTDNTDDFPMGDVRVQPAP
jgi:predicted nucleic acid-binding protein